MKIKLKGIKKWIYSVAFNRINKRKAKVKKEYEGIKDKAVAIEKSEQRIFRRLYDSHKDQFGEMDYDDLEENNFRMKVNTESGVVVVEKIPDDSLQSFMKFVSKQVEEMGERHGINTDGDKDILH